MFDDLQKKDFTLDISSVKSFFIYLLNKLLCVSFPKFDSLFSFLTQKRSRHLNSDSFFSIYALKRSRHLESGSLFIFRSLKKAST